MDTGAGRTPAGVCQNQRFRSGLRALLKFLQAEGRFPWHPQEVPRSAIEYLARQTGLDPAEWWRYDWKGRMIKYHRAEIRVLLGFRKATLADSDSLVLWLHEHCLPNERNPERVKAAALARLRELHLEPPTPDRVDRLVRSAIASYEGSLSATVMKQLSPDTRARLMALLQPLPCANENAQTDSDEEEKSDPAPLHELRREPGKPCLQTVEEELAKLELVQNLKLPETLFAGIPAKLMQSYRQRVAVEELFELRRHPDPLRFTLLAAYCKLRSEELIDTLLD